MHQLLPLTLLTLNLLHAEPGPASAGDLATQLGAVATENKATLRAFAREGCAAVTRAPGAPRVSELQFRGGQTARLFIVEVVRHGELLDISFYTPGTSVLATRTLKVRPGTDPTWYTADGKPFPISAEVKTVPLDPGAFAAARAVGESAPCYVTRLAQDYVRPREYAEATPGAAR